MHNLDFSNFVEASQVDRVLEISKNNQSKFNLYCPYCNKYLGKGTKRNYLKLIEKHHCPTIAIIEESQKWQKFIAEIVKELKSVTPIKETLNAMIPTKNNQEEQKNFIAQPESVPNSEFPEDIPPNITDEIKLHCPKVKSYGDAFINLFLQIPKSERCGLKDITHITDLVEFIRAKNHT